jgi:hypothetical protein
MKKYLPAIRISTASGVLLWTIIISLSLLLSHNAMLYFTHGGDYGILPEKLAARKDWLWNVCFYVHLPAGIICLVVPWLAFARRLSNRFRSVHRIAGKVYVAVTALLVTPTGMYLALYAKGGTITKVGFLLQGILLFWYTVQAFQSATRGDVFNHINNMIRSYSVAAVVLTFRVLHLSFFFLGLPYQDNYAISQWLGLTFNLLMAEIIIIRRSNKFLLT